MDDDLLPPGKLAGQFLLLTIKITTTNVFQDIYSKIFTNVHENVQSWEL